MMMVMTEETQSLMVRATKRRREKETKKMKNLKVIPNSVQYELATNLKISRTRFI